MWASVTNVRVKCFNALIRCYLNLIGIYRKRDYCTDYRCIWGGKHEDVKHRRFGKETTLSRNKRIWLPTERIRGSRLRNNIKTLPWSTMPTAWPLLNFKFRALLGATRWILVSVSNEKCHFHFHPENEIEGCIRIVTNIDLPTYTTSCSRTDHRPRNCALRIWCWMCGALLPSPLHISMTFFLRVTYLLF